MRKKHLQFSAISCKLNEKKKKEKRREEKKRIKPNKMVQATTFAQDGGEDPLKPNG